MKRFKNLSMLFIICAILILNISNVHAAVIFSEDFDTWPVGWTVPTTSPNSAMAVWLYANLSSSCNGSSPPFTGGIGVTSTGCRSGRCMQMPRSSCDSNSTNGGYYGDFMTDIYNNYGHYKELYFRWYVKFDSGFDKPISAGFKMMDRIIVKTPTGTEDSFFPSLHGSKVSSGDVMLYGGYPNGYFASWRTLAPNSTFYPDHAWHCMELRLKLNSAGASDGAVQMWVDGTQTASYTNIMIESSGDYYIEAFKFGLGNVSDEPWDQATYKSMYYDDLVISTSYIGPAGAVSGVGDTTPPVISGGLPSGTLAYGTTSKAMTVTTDETATCKYGTTDVAYASLPNTFSTTGGISHSQTLTGLTNGGLYNYYVRCMDGSNNADTSSTRISFSVSNTSPVINGACGSASGQSFSSLSSSSSNLCATGTVAFFSGSGPWTWGCNGSGGGTSTASYACFASLTTTASTSSTNLLFSEDFEDTNFSARGWYDGGTTGVTTSEYQNGTHAAQFAFANGATTPTAPYVGAMRKLFTASDAVFVDYYIKYPTGWQEQSGNYGHHEIYIASDADNAYTSLAFAHTMGYIEHWGTSGSSTSLIPHMTIQDGANIDQSNINVDLTGTTENRSANGCNGLRDSSFFTFLDCYNSGSGTYWNGKLKGAPTASMSLNAWHHVQAYFKMNTVTNSKGNADGTMAYWLDGVEQFRSDAVLFRTNQHATMKFNQFVIAPFMGNGAPRAQAFYIDNLKVYDGILSSSSINPVSGLNVISVTP